MDSTFRQHLMALLIMTSGVLLVYHPIVRNKTTPGGDGGRIFSYIQFMDNAETFYPLWNPYKLGGVPTLANPDRSFLLGKLIDSEFKYANLQLNLIFILVLIMISFSAYLLARELGISTGGAICVGLILISSWFFFRCTDAGRFNALVALMLINFITYLYIRYIKNENKVVFFGVSILVGFVLNENGYYALITLYPLLVATGLFYNKGKYDLKRTILNTAIQVIIVSGIGILVFAVFLLPMVSYLLPTYSNIEPKSCLSETLPQPGSLINIFIPLFTWGTGRFYPFVSIVSLPLITLLIANYRQVYSRKWIIFVTTMGLSLCVLMGRMSPFSWLIVLFEKTPLLEQIRSQMAFTYLLTLSMAFISGFGFEAVRLHEPKGKMHRLVPLIGFGCFIFLTIVFDALGSFTKSGELSLSGYLTRSYLFNLEWSGMGKFMIILLLVIFPYTCCSRQKIVAYLVVLFLMQISVFRLKSEVRPVENKIVLVKSRDVLNNDDVYYRIWGDGNFTRSCIGLPKVRALNGYSMFFANEHRWSLEMLFEKKVDELRPSWVRRSAFEKWDEEMIKLLNIKYIITPRRCEISDKMRADWELVKTERSNAKLWRRKDWESALRVFDKWRVLPDVKDVLSEMLRREFKAFNEVYINNEPWILANNASSILEHTVDVLKYSESEALFDIDSNKNGIFFIPEYFDGGWKATVDGMPVEILRADACFRGIPVTAGSHLVKVYYAPEMFNIGLFISISTIGTGGLFLFWEYRRGVVRKLDFKNCDDESHYRCPYC